MTESLRPPVLSARTNESHQFWRVLCAAHTVERRIVLNDATI
jgi:hypothetical protein